MLPCPCGFSLGFLWVSSHHHHNTWYCMRLNCLQVSVSTRVCALPPRVFSCFMSSFNLKRSLINYTICIFVLLAFIKGANKLYSNSLCWKYYFHSYSSESSRSFLVFHAAWFPKSSKAIEEECWFEYICFLGLVLTTLSKPRNFWQLECRFLF